MISRIKPIANQDKSSTDVRKAMDSADKAKYLVEAQKTNEIIPIPRDVSVLVVDADSACLAIVSKMLCTYGYKVVTTRSAADALRITEEREAELNLVLTEVHLPDMDRYEFLEKMQQVSKLPLIVMTHDNNEISMLGGLYKGACLYIVKPVTMNDLKNLWQFTFMKKFEVVVYNSKEHETMIESQSLNTLSASLKARVVMSIEDEKSQRMAKRKKQPEEMEEVNKDVNIKELGEENGGSMLKKRPKLIWNNELHEKFLQAIGVLGIDGAHPKEIHEHMNVPGLTKQNVASHLQSYRLALKREEETIPMTMTSAIAEPVSQATNDTLFPVYEHQLILFSSQQLKLTPSYPAGIIDLLPHWMNYCPENPTQEERVQFEVPAEVTNIHCDGFFGLAQLGEVEELMFDVLNCPTTQVVFRDEDLDDLWP